MAAPHEKAQTPTSLAAGPVRAVLPANGGSLRKGAGTMSEMAKAAVVSVLRRGKGKDRAV